MSAREVDEYLATLDQPEREALQTLRFAVDTPLPNSLVRKLISTRKAEIENHH